MSFRFLMYPCQLVHAFCDQRSHVLNVLSGSNYLHDYVPFMTNASGIFT